MKTNKIKKLWLRFNNLFSNRYLDVYKLNQLKKRGVTPLFNNHKITDLKECEYKEKTTSKGFNFFNLLNNQRS